MTTTARPGGASPGPVRCAIYARQSPTDRGPTDFSSCDAQRDVCERYIRSQRSRGREIEPTSYEDEGFANAVERYILGEKERPQ